jgi:predicted dehydrogenase
MDLLEWLLGPIVHVSADQAFGHGLEGVEDVVTVRLRFANGATGALVTLWHDILSRLSNRHVEVFTERCWADLRGEWLGTVSWDRGEGDSGSLQGEELARATARLSATAGENPDGAFVRAVYEGGGATPSITEAIRPHELVDAAYRSAADGGSVVEVSSTLDDAPPPARGGSEG